MDSSKKKKFFLLISLDQINFVVLSEDRKILLEKKSLVNDFTVNQNFKTLEEFLHQNIFDLEKKINNYIKEID